MKNTAEAVKDQTAKDQAPKAKAPKAKRELAAKVVKNAATDSEPADRLPANLEELKATKGGLVSYLFLSGKDKEEITKELKAAFTPTSLSTM